MAYYDLGTHRRQVTTSSGQAQLWFDRGLVWLYGYNHDAAIQCFRQALEANPGCAMAHWGIAAASGPNYSLPWQDLKQEEQAEMLATARAAIEAARGLGDGLPPIDRYAGDTVRGTGVMDSPRDIAKDAEAAAAVGLSMVTAWSHQGDRIAPDQVCPEPARRGGKAASGTHRYADRRDQLGHRI